MWITDKAKIKLTLIRHGETIGNIKGLYYGKTNLPLTENGTNELLELKKNFIYNKPQLIINSGLLRTVQTTNILFDNPNYLIIRNFQEMNFGIYEMKSHENLKNVKRYKVWLNNIETYIIPNGESKKSFEDRIKKGVFELNEYYEKFDDITIVVHGGVIASIMNNIFPGKNNFYSWIPKNGYGYEVSFEDGNISYKEIPHV